MEVVISLHDGMAYDLEPLAAAAGQRKAKAACPGATSIRQAGVEVVISLHDGMAYDLEPLAAAAGQRKANVACSGAKRLQA
ncbi:hypothetical protein [Cytobacillus praedii]|uniref:hypothetical protein n=1 Tax=Cytobacillus praedii TaxID=1742358 RepID=UPI002E217CE6|nr:hypothetical protein [Cytobacillus praedii]